MLTVMEAYQSDKDVLLAAYREQHRVVDELKNKVDHASNLLKEADSVMSVLHPHAEWRRNYRRFHQECVV